MTETGIIYAKRYTNVPITYTSLMWVVSATMDNACQLTELIFFFFQAEDGIRYYKVTGVQTCALPIYVLVAAATVLLDPLPRDAESLAVLRAGRHLEHHALPVQRPHLDPGAEHRLREVDRHHTRDVEASALAPEKPVRLDVDHDDDVAAPPCALALQPEPRAVVGAGRNVDHQALVDLHVPRALTRGAALRRDLPAAAAHRTGPRHREAALAERDRAPAPALGTGRERCTRRAAAPPAGGAHFR